MDSAQTRCENCGNDIPPDTTAFLVEGRVVCRACHDELEPTCPTCGERLTQMPQATKPCPHCGWPIYVAREQDLFDTALLNKEQSEQLAHMRRRIGRLRRLGISEGDYTRTQAHLKQETGESPDETMVMRRLFYQASQNCWTDEQRAAVAHAEARFLYDQGVDYFNVLRKAHRLQLAHYKSQGIDGVTIVGPPTCAYCKKRAGCPLVIDREIQEPELPYVDCPNRTIETDVIIEGEHTQHVVNKNAFCEGTYEPYE